VKRLTDTQKTEIRGLRASGYGYGTIAQQLSLPRETVRSFCVRNNKADETHAGITDSIGTDSLRTDSLTPHGLKSENASEFRSGNTVFIIKTGYSETASETLEQKLKKLILADASKPSESYPFVQNY
jgi:hypothetical protein